ncbi:MAG: nitronate monooxygenase, partial [Thermodesulfobacteriota bacterium]
MLQTKMTEILGVKYPIQCGTMQGITTADLVAPVANAGGFCCIPAAMFQTKQDFMDEIKKARDLTDKPFGVNVGLFPEMTTTVTAEERINWVIDSGVKILETAGRSPAPYRDQITKGGLTHIHKCARVRDAVKVDGLGVDMVSIVGTECGGHPSMEDVTTLVLIPSALDQIKKPLIAGGGLP